MLTFLFILLAIAALVAGGFAGVKVTGDDKIKLNVPFVSVGAVVSLLFFALAFGNVNVDAGSRGILKRFGKPVRVLDPGLHFIRPIGDQVISIPVQTRTIKPQESAASKDLQIVNFEITFRYHIDPSQAMHFLVDLNNDQEDRIIKPVILEAIKAGTSQYDVQELISRRTEVRDRMEALITKALAGTYIIPESVSITEFNFSKEYEDAIEKKQVAQQKAEQATNDLARIKVEAQQVEAKAKGKADAAIAEATGEAQSTLIVAKAKAEAQRVQKENITPELIQIRTIELFKDKWDGELPTMLVGSTGGFLPTLDMVAARNKAQEIRNYKNEQKQKQVDNSDQNQ